MTINNFFQSAAGAFSRAGDALKQRAMGAYDSVRGAAVQTGRAASDFASGFTAPSAAGEEAGAQQVVQSAQRAAATGLEAAPGVPGPRAQPGTDFVVDSSGVAQRPGQPGGLRSTPESEAARAADPYGRTGPTRMQMLKSAANYTPRGLSGRLATIGRAAGPLASIPEVYYMDKNIQSGENPLKSVGRFALRTGGAMLGGAAGAAAGTLAGGPVGTLAGGMAGGYGGYKAGDSASTALFGEDPSSKPAGPDGATPQPATSPNTGASGSTASPASPTAGIRMEHPTPGRQAGAMGSSEDPNTVELTDGNRARPGVLTDTNFGVPAEGQGAFRRTTPGNEGVAQPLGSNGPDAGYNQPSSIRGASPRLSNGAPSPAGAPAGSQAAQASSYGLREVPQVQAVGWGAPRANKLNAELQMQARGQDATLASNMIQRQIARDNILYQRGQDNAVKLNKATEDYVRGKTGIEPSHTVGDSGAARAAKDTLEKETSAVKDRINYTLGDRSEGTNHIEGLSGTEHQQLLVADKIRDMYEKNKDSSAFKWLRDYVGNNRFNSRNLDSYMPAKAERKGEGIYVTLGNGNNIRLKEIQGGGFSLFGPNDPVDTDIKQVMDGRVRQLLEKENSRSKR